MLRSTKLPNVFRSTSLREARQLALLSTAVFTEFRSTSLREARPFIGSCFFKRFTYLDPLASGRLDVIVI